ncbi:bifunctional precorrin-2 dehydrogenase/sirohydrochlorin ferrochelatase [Fulvivirgaceae bacterium BMA10]|uniref:precorrin-2 dehydrogenase n=1 Tax=Splendidivirga corallicola TaxID=3051826 RepID=A0ABT8KY36_9BACT|nr:bifunctional precorrin-2 dehydrogenase/sirohydrochlorin ferrochelatase [Fulvivirgaceae bacterium BMA10]
MNQKKAQGNVLFPIFLKIDQLQVLIVGGGNVGLEKLEALLKNDPNARVNLVGISIKKEIVDLSHQHPNISLSERAFQEHDLEGVDVAILATADRKTNLEIKNLARGRRILTNVADTPDLCDFYLGSTVKKGDLKIGISTNGTSPTFAKRFREVLEDILPDETNALLQNLRGIRDNLKGNFSYKVKKLNEVTSSLVSNK